MCRKLTWVHPNQSKNRKAISVPLNPDAMRLIASQSCKHPTHVFTYDGKPVTKLSTVAWYKALKRARIEDFRWHDAAYLGKLACPEWNPDTCITGVRGESEGMVRRYSHLSASHLAVYTDKLPSLMCF